MRGALHDVWPIDLLLGDRVSPQTRACVLPTRLSPAETAVQVYAYGQRPERPFVELGPIAVSTEDVEGRRRSIDMTEATRAGLHHDAAALGGTAVIVTAFYRVDTREGAAGIAIRLQ